jgi:hypothetical protein
MEEMIRGKKITSKTGDFYLQLQKATFALEINFYK